MAETLTPHDFETLSREALFEKADRCYRDHADLWGGAVYVYLVRGVALGQPCARVQARDRPLPGGTPDVIVYPSWACD